MTNEKDGSVTVVDTTTNRVVATFALGIRARGVTLSPDGRHVYTANGLSNGISVIDTASRGVVAAVKAGNGPWGVAIGR